MTQLGEFRIDDQLVAQGDALLAAIVRNASDAIIAIDAAGIIISWNRGAHIHFGYPESETIGLPVTLMIPTDRIKEQEAALVRIFAGEQLASFQSVRTTRTGQDLAVSIVMSPIHDAKGTVIAASAIIRPRHHARRKAADEQGDLLAALPGDKDAVESRNRNILVVEDEPLIGMGLALMLENAGFEVIGPVEDVRSAMALLDEHGCGLAILDISLAHGETSAPLAERLKRSGIPFLVASGNFATHGSGIFADAPALTKPFGARTLVAAVQEALG